MKCAQESRILGYHRLTHIMISDAKYYYIVILNLNKDTKGKKKATLQQ